MAFRVFSLLFLTVLASTAAKNTVATSKGENQDLILTVTLHIDRESIKELIGNDLDGHYFIADVKVEPKYGKDVVVDRDDFQLRTDKDGDRTKPFAPSEIAGGGALIISQKGQQGAASPGMVGLGLPSIVGGVGAGKSAEPNSPVRQQNHDPDNNPLKKLLTDKMLPEGKTDKPVSGLVYFPMEKQKMKDLELTYGGQENRITLRFK